MIWPTEPHNAGADIMKLVAMLFETESELTARWWRGCNPSCLRCRRGC